MNLDCWSLFYFPVYLIDMSLDLDFKDYNFTIKCGSIYFLAKKRKRKRERN